MLKRTTRLFSLTLLLSIVGAAQTTTGGIEGKVTDPSGALIAGANVDAMSVATGMTVSVHSAADGHFQIQHLTPGLYQVSAAMAGFRKTTITVPVQLGVIAKLPMVLRVEADQVSLEVNAPLDSSKSTIKTVISQEEIAELPLQSRTFTDLLFLVPGIRPQGSFARNKARVVTFSVNGSDGRNSDVNLDGMDNRDYIFGGFLQSLPLPAVREYQVTTANGLPESGRSNGAQVDVVSRTGSKNWHGEVFYNLRDDSLSKRNFFLERDGAPKAPSSRHNAGFAIGRDLSKNIFFWAGTEYLRDRDNNFVTNAALDELRLIPGAIPKQFIPRPFYDSNTSGRLDWFRDERNHYFLRLAGQRNVGRNELQGEPAAADISNGNRTSNRFLSASMAWTHTFNGSDLNDLRLGFLDSRSVINPNSSAPNLNFATATFPGVPDTPAVQIGANQSTPGVFYQTRYQLRDDFTFTRGRHSMSFGASDIYHPRLGGLLLFGSLGHIVTFFDRPSEILGNPALYPQGFATPGAVQNIQFSNGDGSFRQATNQIGIYANDRVRLTSQLTLNLGLRYDYAAGAYPDNRRDLAFQALKAIGSPLAARQPSAPKTNFQPRFGLAWNPDGEGRSVFTLGYGIFFDSFIQQFALPNLQRENETIFSTPIDLTNTRAGTSGPATGGDMPTFRFGVDPLPVAPAGAALAANSTVRFLDPNFRNAYVQNWTAGYERRLGKLWTVGSNYTHILGIGEQLTVEANPRPEGGGPRRLSAAFAAAGVAPLGSIREFSSINRSRYDALTFTARRAFHERMYWQSSYVLSRAVTYGGRFSASYNFGRARVADTGAFAPGEFGPSSADERHRFVTSAILILPGGFEIAPVLQAASARPYTVFSGNDDNQDGVQAGSGEEGIFGDRLVFNGRQLPVNSQRGDPFFQLDLRASRNFNLGEKGQLRVMADFFNLTNKANFGNNYFTVGPSAVTNPQPRGLFGKQGEVGSTVGVPFEAQLGLRLTF